MIDRIECRPDVVHVIGFRLDSGISGGIDLLDADERRRAARLVFDDDRERFITAHAWTRILLARCVDQSPESLSFALGPRGKPRLSGAAACEVRFNLSHSGDRALLAITAAEDVGVDLEQHRAIDVAGMARRFFSRAEAKAIDALPQSERPAAFFRCWTRKEAFIKALGDGLAFPLDGFEVSVAHGAGASQLLLSCAAAPEALKRWRIVALDAAAGYAAAVAASGSRWTVMRWDADSPPRPPG